MLQAERPGDYVVATGESHSVKDLVETTFGHVDLDWKRHVVIDPRYFRPSEVDHLRGDTSQALRDLGWKPRVSFPELVRMMVDHDLELARQERTLRNAGHAPMSRGGPE
jgi:GDPmannose 4,6-dehydratase